MNHGPILRITRALRIKLLSLARSTRSWASVRVDGDETIRDPHEVVSVLPVGRSCTSDETREPLEASPSSILARSIGSFLGWTLFPTLIRTQTAHQASSLVVIDTMRSHN